MLLLNTGARVSFHITFFSWYMSRSGIARSYGSSIYNFLKEPPYCSPGFSGGTSDKESACQCRRHKRHRLGHWVGKILWRGNGTPLQYSCQENSTGRRAWWAAVHEAAESWTRLSDWVRTGTHILFSVAATLIYIPTNSVGRFPFLQRHRKQREAGERDKLEVWD